MSKISMCVFFTNSPSALNETCCPTKAAVGCACGTRLGVGVGVRPRKVSVGGPEGVGVGDLKGPVGLGPGVGLGGTRVPAPITMVSSAKPAPGLGLGQTPAWKFPN